MASKILLCCLLAVACEATPQRNAPAGGRPTGKEFLDLLHDDFTNEEYESLLDEFVVS